jgi:N-methylhydantoinase A/oxoprolinase/acetone carboxylase beta subunit
VGLHKAWDRQAAEKAAALFARKRTRLGAKLAENAEEISRRAVAAVIKASAENILDVCLAEQGELTPKPSAHPLVQAAIQNRSALVRLNVELSVPIVALGAAAATYYPDVARQLNTEAVIPKDADVANAIGAVVGHVRVSEAVTISRPADHLFRAHQADGLRDFSELADAIAAVERSLRAHVTEKAAANGAGHVNVTLSHEKTAVTIGSEELFLELRITATAVGRPSLA